jgi:hypothetical protein
MKDTYMTYKVFFILEIILDMKFLSRPSWGVSIAEKLLFELDFLI